MPVWAGSEVDLFYTYDAFSPLVWFALERFGFCRYGLAADYLDAEGMAIGSHLPINTHGGMLSEGHLSAWGHTVEAVVRGFPRRGRATAGGRCEDRSLGCLLRRCHGVCGMTAIEELGLELNVSAARFLDGLADGLLHTSLRCVRHPLIALGTRVPGGLSTRNRVARSWGRDNTLVVGNVLAPLPNQQVARGSLYGSAGSACHVGGSAERPADAGGPEELAAGYSTLY